MSEPNVVRLIPPTDVPLSSDTIGPKAMSLVRMGRIHLPVPPAFCVTAQAYLDHLQRSSLVPEIEQTLSALESASVSDTSEISDLLGQLRERIIGASLSDSLSRDVQHHLATLPSARCAVRSSATAEDLPGHSFAGLYDTFLGVADLPSCLDAIKKCWASLWTLRAYQYRRHNNFDHLKTAMSVIVQTLIPADSSGVIFTANPLTGRPSTITIEACFGLGEALVSGKVTPDRFTFQKRNLKLALSLVAEKSVACHLDESGRICEARLEGPRSKTPSIDRRTATKLARYALKTEDAFGCPQDLEWARHNKRLYLLQSRPITIKPEPLSWEERQIWSNLNLGEVAPDVMTPITRSFISPMLHRIFGTLFKIFCVDIGDHRLADVIAGRLYFNINTAFGIFGHVPTMRKQEFDHILGGAHAELFRSGRLDLAEEDIPQLKGSFAKMLLRLPLTIYDIYAHRLAKAQAGLEQLMADNNRLEALDIPNLPTPELVDSLKTVFNIAFVDVDLMHLMTTIYALPLVYKLSASWLGDGNATLAARLFTGLGNMADAEAGLALWRLAHRVHKNPEIEKAILAQNGWPQTQREIAALPQGEQFLTEWHRFLREHGHHCRGELELYNARWAETPEYCLDMVRSYISCIGSSDPSLHQQQRVQERRQAAETCRERLRNPLKRWLFSYLVRQGQCGCVLRENYKNEAVRLVSTGRKILRELGQRLFEKGWLGRADDIFFLEADEVEAVARGDIPSNLGETIRSRRQEYDRFCSITPPKVIIGKFDPDDFTPDPVDTSQTTLKGISASPGVVTGKARVILRADNDQHLERGEILVAPFTDPGWTPYFLPAAAIVMDQGGILSHGSIVAREYGIPAVVNVGPATQIIKTGQTITVDADRGAVLLHERH